jgi:hypothetical protein
MIGAATLALDEYVFQPQADLFVLRVAGRQAMTRAQPA